MEKYTPATYQKSAFNCPNCGAFSNQLWHKTYFQSGGFREITNLKHSLCTHCNTYSLWRNEKMMFPSTGNAPLANSDLPEDIQEDYEEARAIMSISPRGSAALLRLAIQKLCKHLGEKGKNINQDIGNLVQKGLPVKIQKSLDIVRVIGNDAVHPGTIDLKDDTVTAGKLFILVNLIADVMITQPKEIDDLFDSLPEDKKNGITNRDNK
ncbi:DUF4145 domain-containing protein [uncultured Polaribacter sp.]|uniref:DUF4145 domain-containing protein n=1 Tax=uncultured Polaribacter sp. TaxID=174711 RepID=UPI00261CA569|nr:DUF4145 domain-containing protein [uncultured Polaribacter sp.]